MLIFLIKTKKVSSPEIKSLTVLNPPKKGAPIFMKPETSLSF